MPIIGSIILLSESTYTASSQIVLIQKIGTNDYGDPDLAEKINKANMDCISEWCEIIVEGPGIVASPIYLSQNRVLTFGAFNYTIAATIYVNSNNEIRGQDMEKTVLKRDPVFFAGKNSDMRTDPPSDFNKLQSAYMIAINSNRTHTSLHDFTIDGNTAAIGYYDIEGANPSGKLFHYPKGRQSELLIMDSSDVNVDSIRIRDMQKGGLAMIGAKDVTISNSEFASNGWNGDTMIYSGIRPNQNIQILNNYVHGGSHNGIFLSSADDVVIHGNRIDANRQNTFFTGSGGQICLYPDVTNVVISNNNITNAGFVSSAELPKLNKNLFGYGIEMHASHVQIINNTITGNAGWGIFLQDNRNFSEMEPTHDILVKGNIMTDNGFAANGKDYLIQSDRVYNVTWDDNIIGQS